jgi:alginate O-acetyltransferase complex protein AlgJ
MRKTHPVIRFCTILLMLALLGAGKVTGVAIELEGKLLKRVGTPDPKQIRPYRRALCTFLYQVEKVHQGNYQKEEILVAKWTVWQGGKLEGLPEKPGTIERLELNAWNSHPEFANERLLSNEGDFNRVLYYDPGSHPETGRKQDWKVVAREMATGLESGVVKGQHEGWLFLASEIQHAQLGGSWMKVKPDTPSPREAVLDFQKRLKDQQVELLLVPVPTKLSCHPVSLQSGLTITKQAPFLEELRQSGVNVIDLEPVFTADFKKNGKPVFCAQDSHWAPHGAQVAAREIALWMKEQKWFPSTAQDRKTFQLGDLEFLEIKGDLARLLPTPLKPETLLINRVHHSDREDHWLTPQNPSSPVILLGDSHLTVFSSTDKSMHCQGAGLLDYLALETGLSCDVVANYGSGSHGARLNLYQRSTRTPTYWENKKLVIWCFSIREFSQGQTWSTKIPVRKNDQ